MIDLGRRALQVAPDLLGSRLTSRIGGDLVTVRIVEVEAYEGADDPASHAHRGERQRNRVMFGPPGHLYVYRHMGLHHCTNVVVGPVGVASAVLLRGAEVLDGVDVAWRRRLAGGACRSERDLARGPARLAVVL
uniref:DNA-3-methyladenine glycosylase n=1 Tax=Pseudactinotalea sp. TaxID=1926260 RepID=UPI003B3AD283